MTRFPPKGCLHHFVAFFGMGARLSTEFGQFVHAIFYGGVSTKNRMTSMPSSTVYTVYTLKDYINKRVVLRAIGRGGGQTWTPVDTRQIGWAQ